MKDCNYALEMWIVDLLQRDVFEGYLHARNAMLVERARQFESRALSYVKKFGWNTDELARGLFPAERRRQSFAG